jgi:O-antigen/teichoic acid export membrane protein
MKDLKEKAVRGGLARVAAQGATFLLRIGSLMVLARLIDPKDFGLVGMVTAFTGILNLFRDFGLGTAAVQNETVTDDQISNLFWLNVVFGLTLAVVTVALAPLIVTFYHEPRLFSLTMVLATGLLFNALGVQHSAILQRNMQFTALSVISVVSIAVSSILAIVMAKLGFGYWALVAMAISNPLISTFGLWVVARWIPRLPRRGAGLRSMMRFGATITLNSVVVYLAYNMEKVLLGRFWGANAIGIYGRAYQLVNVPTDNLNSAAGEVAFSTLSRIQNEPKRLRSYFLRGYSLIVCFTIPITVIAAIFAKDLIAVLLGPKWQEAVPIFRLLAPTIAIFAMINPFGWLLLAIGKVKRSLNIAFVIAPLVMAGYICGLPYGPKGVAFGYSAAMTLWLFPNIVWCTRGTAITVPDVLRSLARPLTSAFAASAVVLLVSFSLRISSPFLRLAIGISQFLAVYAFVLLFVMDGKGLFSDLVSLLVRRDSKPEQEPQPAR